MGEQLNDVMGMLVQYAGEKHLSWTRIAQLLGVTQNTVTNWKKGRTISQKNAHLILDLISKPDPGCSTEQCPFRNTEDPFMNALFLAVSGLNDKGRAMLYTYALELRNNTALHCTGPYIPEHETSGVCLVAFESRTAPEK